MNELGAKSIPFLFIFDFELKKPIVIPMKDIDNEAIKYFVNGQSNHSIVSKKIEKKISLKQEEVDFLRYERAFHLVMSNINAGNSYLLNLTFPTKIETNLSLEEIYTYSSARYKLLLKNEFVCFSPEIFVQICDGKIASFPMKGTIDASIPDACNLLLNNKKELAEHITIVDLIRNDLSMVAKDVIVEKFRYVEEIRTNRKTLLQASSKISGRLDAGYKSNLGSIIARLLPAGSISGAPKKKTVEIIKEAEAYNRGYYTGIFGVFDGKNLDSGVMIRFIEQIDGEKFFKSGGGITSFSELDYEYNELKDKVYVPIV